MVPSQIASIASAVSGLTATVSLIYLGIQIRLNVRHMRRRRRLDPGRVWLET